GKAVPPPEQLDLVNDEKRCKLRAGARFAAFVLDYRGGLVPEQPAVVGGPQREFGLLAVEKERLVPRSDVAHRLGGHEHGGTGRPDGRTRFGVLSRIRNELAERTDPTGSLAEHGFGKSAADRGHPAKRWLQAAVQVKEQRYGDAAPGFAQRAPQ